MSHVLHDTAGLPNVPALATDGGWETIFAEPARKMLEAVLPDFVTPRRWFGSKARVIRSILIVETVPILPAAYLVVLRVEYAEGTSESYVLPVGFAAGMQAQTLRQERPAAVIATLAAGQELGILYDAIWDPQFCEELLATIKEGRRYHGTGGDLVAAAGSSLPRLHGDAKQALPPVLLGVEQSNTSVRYGDRLILKLYRRLEAGANPDQEMGQFLSEQTHFANTPPFAGVLEFRPRERAGGEPTTVAFLQGFVPNQGDAWHYTLTSLAGYFAAARPQGEAGAQELAMPQASLLELIRDEVPTQAEALIGPYLASARLLGRRTAELHLALSSAPADPAFAPEPFSAAFQSDLHQSMRGLTDRIMNLLRARFESLAAADQAEARRVLALEGEIATRFDNLVSRPIQALRLRIHGDYHLGQVLYTGQDFMIIDFEGEPARPLGERRMKRSPLQDVAGMLRSFHYAAYAAYFAQKEEDAAGPELEPWARFWHLWVSVAYLRTYLHVVNGAAFLPAAAYDLSLLLDAYLLEKAVYELGYELNNRPGWVRIPLEGILDTIGSHSTPHP